MNCVVAIATQADRLPHLLASEVLFEPLVTMASPWNQVMLSRSCLGDAITKPALILLFHLLSLPAVLLKCEGEGANVHDPVSGCAVKADISGIYPSVNMERSVRAAPVSYVLLHKTK